MRRKAIICLMVMSLSLLSGCSNTSEEETESETTTEEKSTSSYELMMSYVEQIQKDFTREQVEAIMGEPDRREGSGIMCNYYVFDEYEICVIYFSDGLLLDVINKNTNEKTHIY